MSNGRVIFGAGAGVDFDFAPFGEPVDAKTRAAMLDEGLALLNGLLSGEEVTHRGAHYTAQAVRLAPSPVQQPRIPVWIGGDSKAALRRAARWDGWIMGTIDEQLHVTNPPEKIAAQVATIRQQRVVDSDAPATWWFECIFGTRGSIVEDYPEDVRGHSCLMLGHGIQGRPIHVVCSPKEEFLTIITAYLPHPMRWRSDWKTRIK